VGEARPFGSIAEMVADPGIDALWLCGPNHARIENVEEIVDAVERGRGEVRHLLTEPGQPASSLEVRRVTGHIASLKWTRPEYARRLKRTMGAAVDYSKRPSEDYASVVLEFETPDGSRVIGEASWRTGWRS
jgi:hypothetical protein